MDIDFLDRMDRSWEELRSRPSSLSEEAVFYQLAKTSHLFSAVLLQCRKEHAPGAGTPYSVVTKGGFPTLLIDTLLAPKLTMQEAIACLKMEATHVLLEHDKRRQDRDPFVWSLSTEVAAGRLVRWLPGWFIHPEDLDLPPSLHDAECEALYDFIVERSEEWADAIRIRRLLTSLPTRSVPGAGPHGSSRMKQVVLKAVSSCRTHELERYAAQLERLDENDETEEIELSIEHWFLGLPSGQVSTDWKRISRRTGEVPGRRIELKKRVAVVIDTSRSVPKGTLQRFRRVTRFLMDTLRASILLVQSDVIVRRTHDLDRDELPLSIEGRGRTDLQAPLRYLETTEPSLAGAIFATDGKAEPPTEPPFPVCWLIPPGGRRPARWGECVYL